MDCVIREWRLEDKIALAENLNNLKILNNLRDGLPYPYTPSDAEFYIKSMLSADKENTFAFAITADDSVIGSIGVFRCENIHSQTAEMGYYIGEPYWGKGLMTSAVKQVCKYVFDNTNIIRIFAEPFAHNTASCRVLEKAGFQFEGTLRSNAVKNGKVVDMKMYALVREYMEENIMKSICGIDCTNCELSGTCNGCMATGGYPFGAECLIAQCCKRGETALNELKEKLIAVFNALHISDMEEVTELNALKGSFVNIEYTLPNGQIVKFWDDNRIYLGNQLHKKGSDRCYGIIADEKYVMVSEYRGFGTEAEIIVFKQWN